MLDKGELEEFTNKVRDNSDILTVISKYVALKRRGSQYWGCCPFHNEKTPSFTVSPEKGFFYCFGCHIGGNIFRFISLIEHITYFEAVKLQAERLNIPLPTSNQNKTPSELKLDQQKKDLYEINTLAKNFFHSCLVNTQYGEVGRKYLKLRGITDETIKDFEIGFAPDSWNALSKALIKKKGKTSEQLIMAGLAKLKKNGLDIYDNFRNRVMIPIVDINGKVVGFGGRILDEQKSFVNQNNFEVPKYLNSPETLIFNKKNLLFGLNKALLEIRNLGYVIIVEGYMDVISVYSAGIKNVVASLGTAFTEEQAKLLSRFTQKIIFCYDNDAAGQKATMRALEIFLNPGAEIKIVVVPDAKDPDEYIHKNGAESFRNLLSKALSMIDYQIQYSLKTTEHMTLEGKINALRKILPFFVKIKDFTMQSEYRKRIAKELMLEEDIIIAETKKFLENPIQQITPIENVPKPVKKLSSLDELQLTAGRMILNMAWYETDTLQYVISILKIEAFAKVHQEIIHYLKNCIEKNQSPSDITASQYLNDEAISEISNLLIEGNNFAEEEKSQAYAESIKTLKSIMIKKNYAKIIEEIKSLEKYDSNFADNPEYIQKVNKSLELKRELNKLTK